MLWRKIRTSSQAYVCAVHLTMYLGEGGQPVEYIEPPIDPRNVGPRVRNLQEALRRLGQDVDDREVVDEFFGDSTMSALRLVQERLGIRVTGQVDVPTADVLNAELTRQGAFRDDAPAQRARVVVTGAVRDASRRPFADWQLSLRARTLREERELANTVSAGDGQFEFAIDPIADDLRLQIVARDPTGSSTARSALFRPDFGLVVDIEGNPPADSSYDRLLGSITPMLAGIGIADLVEDDVHQDISFLASESGYSGDELSNLTVAHRVQATFDIPAAATYALIDTPLTQNPINLALDLTDRFSVIDSITARVGASVMAMSDAATRKALLAAIDRGAITEEAIGSVDAAVAQIARQRVEYTLDNPLGTGKSQLRQLLSLTGLGDQEQRGVAEAMLAANTPGGGFWKTLERNGLAPETVGAVRQVTEIGSYTKNHLPLVSALRDKVNNGGAGAVRSLARMSREEWVDYIKSGPPELVPDNVIADNLGDRQRMLGEEIYERVVRGHPSTALIAEADRRRTADPGVLAHMTAICDGEKPIDLLRTDVDQLFVAEPERLQSIPDDARPQVLGQIRRHQRALRLASHPVTATAMLTAQLDSATRVTARGRAQFMEFAKAQQIAPFDASRIYRKAEITHALIAKTLAEFAVAADPSAPTVLPRQAPSPEQQAKIDEHPTLRRLFGSQDFCACAECNSVYSPAAYLCDLLLWLRERTQPAGAPVATALDGLLLRRPDIAELKLDCDNTHVELPYIDLVNELLEDAIAAPPAGTPARQTHGTTAERRAVPEYTNTAAYQTLATTQIPMGLPFDRSFDEALVLLAQLGTSAREISEVFGEELSPLVFGLDPQTLSILTDHGAEPVRIVRMWGVTVAELAHVPQLLSRAGISYEQLREVVDLAWINGSGAVMTIAGVDDSCDTTKMTVQNLSLERADRMHQFLRFWRHTTWTLDELDALLSHSVFGTTDFNYAALDRLYDASCLQTDYHLSVNELVSLFGMLSTRESTDRPSLYSTLFEPVSVADPVPELKLAAVTAAGVTVTTEKLGPAIAAGLGVTAADLARLVPLATGKPVTTVTLETLTKLWRWVRLAGVLGVTIEELTLWQRLLGSDPFASLRALRSWLSDMIELAGFGIEPADLTEMLAPTRVPIGDDVAAAIIEELRSVLAKLPEQAGEASPQSLVALLPGLADQVSQARAAALLVGKTATTAAEDAVFVSATVVPVLGAAVAPLFEPIDPATPADTRTALVEQRLRDLAKQLRRLALHNAVVDVLARAIDTHPDLMRVLVSAVTITAVGAPAVSAIDALETLGPDRATAEAAPAVRIDAAGFPDAFTAIRRLAAAARLATALHLTPVDLRWLTKQDTDRWVSIANPPTAMGDSLPFAAFHATARLFLLLKPSARAGRSWTEVIDLIADTSVSYDALVSQLAPLICAATVLPPKALTEFAAVLGDVEAEDQAETRSELLTCERLLRQTRIAALVARVGTDAYTLVDWAFSPAERVGQMWDALRARYSYDDWIADLPRITDPLRERRRDALVAYLETRPPTPNAWRDANTMFNYFLLDVKMAACLSTSRIVQAYSSVQLFTQRALMNREAELSGVVADAILDDGWKQWPARSQQPIFAANLQIWHYPENWLNQIDRPGKSEAFAELERELSGQDVTAAAVEDALLRYFERLDEVARLRVIGFHDDRVTGNIHVIGRTESAPHHHYYRVRASGRWSPWTKLPVDIHAESVSLIVFRRRLHAFWVTPTLKPIPMSGKSDSPAPRYGEVELSWTLLRAGKWSPTRTAAELLYVLAPLNTLEVGLRLSARSSSLLVDAYSPKHLGYFLFDGRNAYAVQSPTVWGTIRNSIPNARLGRSENLTGPMELPSPATDLAWRGDRLVNTTPTQSLTFTSAPGQFTPNGPLLENVTGPFTVLGPAQDTTFDPACPFFFEWQGRTWLVTGQRMYQKGSTWTPELPSDPLAAPYNIRYTFTRFFYPYADMFFEQLDDGGIERLYRRALQWDPNALSMSQTPSFKKTFSPVAGRVRWGPDVDTLDYVHTAPDFVYNMEPFIHVADRVAEELVRAGRPEAALRYLGFILDWTHPSTMKTAGRYWIPRLFAELSDEQVYQQRINRLLEGVNSHDPALEAQVKEWRDNPFQPFRIADMRVTAYMKSIAMKTIAACIACGDKLFAAPSRNNLNQAALFYLTAAEILGPRPHRVAPPQLPAMSFRELSSAPGGLDDFANFAADLENCLPQVSGEAPGTPAKAPTPSMKTFYFKIPPNPKLLQYWDIVEDRMFKLRHCQDIAGQALALPLLDPPVDPGVLVRAVAAGIDLAQVIASTNAPLPHERFMTMYARAERITAAVTALGRDLLTALERRDTEKLLALRTTQEVELASLIDETRQLQIDEANAQIHTARATLDVLEARRAFNADQPKTYTGDDIALGLSIAAGVLQVIALIPKLASSAAAIAPKVEAGVSGWGGHATVAISGMQLSQTTDKFGDTVLLAAALLDRAGAASATMAAHTRRYDEHQAQAKEAELEKVHIDRTIAALTLEVSLRQKEKELSDKQAQHNSAIDEYLGRKFTATELYDHSVDQLSALYFQAYQTAVELARRAEACFRHELCVTESAYIGYGHWDSLRRGLLAGDRLAADLRRLDNAYHDRNTRRLELVKHVSLLQLDPKALLRLKTTGTTRFQVREIDLDADHPGQYQRRIKTVGVTIPCVVGPYSGINARLLLVASSTRMTDTLTAGKYARDDSSGRDTRFVDELPAVRMIATSTGVNDSGLFEVNMRDERYLPFEGAGTISTWQLDLKQADNAFDVSSVSDVLLEIRYTALPATTPMEDGARALVEADRPTRAVRLYNLRRDFGGAWQRLFAEQGPQQLTLDIGSRHAPFFLRDKQVKASFDFVFLSTGDLDLTATAPLDTTPHTTAALPTVDGARHVAYSSSVALQPITITVAKTGGVRLREGDLADGYVFVTFKAEP